MIQEFDRARQVYINRDAQGIARELLHFDHPVQIVARTPQAAAGDYLRRFGDLLGISQSQLSNLDNPPSATLTQDGVEYRRLSEKAQFDTVTASFAQTDLGVPVWEAGVALTLVGGDKVLSAQSTLHPKVSVATPSAEALKHLQELDAEQLRELLGIDERQQRQLRIESRKLVVYQYAATQRIFPRPAPIPIGVRGGGGLIGDEGPPILPLPPVPPGVEESNHYVCEAIYFALPVGNYRELHWVALVAAEPLSVLYLRAFTDAVTGLVFVRDPMTSNGGPLPNATSAALNAVRTSVTLPDLNGPVAGTQSLAGTYVVLQDIEPPPVAPPTEPANSSFDFDARTDNFSAVNAYYHCDAFFQLVQSLGFDVPTYFGGTTFPMPADHRGSISTTDGAEVNAHCVGTAGGTGISYTSFMLADTGDTANPIGIADDYRVVLHELGGHGTLYNHVSSANFHFSHSAGDSIAVATNDPGSQAPDRFVSFPWVNVVGRRHDRDPAQGWGWSGSIALNPFDPTLDPGGYNNEQILSTTMFRLYRSLGGDSSDLNTQTFAARYTVYLILRAIGSLTPATSPATASGFATALMTGDLGDWTSEGQTGGANGKVIRWAFEKQGMFQPPGTATPNNNIGSPPAIDVYIDDGRGGEYPYQPVFWENQSIWNRLAPDGGTTHQEPVVNTTNYGYVRSRTAAARTPPA
jgi:zinc metalloprotease ZmpB